MTDMLVSLYDHPLQNRTATMAAQGIEVKRALATDKAGICDFVSRNFGNDAPGWVNECDVSLSRLPTSCFIAVHDQNLVGFCCYDGVARGMLGPIGVSNDCRDKGVATELLCHCLEGMKADGYAYAIIGWVSSEEFFRKTCGAIAIPDSAPGIYSRLLAQKS